MGPRRPGLRLSQLKLVVFLISVLIVPLLGHKPSGAEEPPWKPSPKMSTLSAGAMCRDCRTRGGEGRLPHAAGPGKISVSGKGSEAEQF